MNKLRGRIREKIGTEMKFAELMGITRAGLSAKLNGKRYWSPAQIRKALEILELDISDVGPYFFENDVRKS